MPSANGMPEASRIAQGRRHAGVGHAEHEVGLHGRLVAPECGPWRGAPGRPICPSITESGRAKYTYSKMQAARGRGGTACSLTMPSAVKRTISPGSTSRTYSAPTMSSPQVSEDTTQPRPSGSCADAQRADAVGVAERVERIGAREHHGVGALQVLHGAADAVAQVVRLPRELADGLGRHLGVGAGAQVLPLVDKLRPQVVRVHQRAVVGERDERVVDSGDVRLRRLPGGASRRWWSSARARWPPRPRKGRQRCLVEDLGHKPQVLRLDDRRTVAHGDARALLAAMLQGLQPVAGQARHVLARRVDAEDAALLFQSIRLLAGKYAIGH